MLPVVLETGSSQLSLSPVPDLSWREVLCLRLCPKSRVACNNWFRQRHTVLGPMTQSGTALKLHFSSRQTERWDQPLCQLWGSSAFPSSQCCILHFQTGVALQMQAKIHLRNPAYNILKSLKHIWGKKISHSYESKKRQAWYPSWRREWFLPVVKILLCLKCHCGHGSAIPVIWAANLLVSYLNCPKFAINHLY